MYAPRPIVSLVLSAALLSCAADAPRTAVQLVLTPDPAIASAAELLAQISRLEVIVDSDTGLAGVDAAGPLAGGGEALDWDGDGVLETRFAGPELSTVESLPVLEIGVARNSDRELLYRVLGYPQAGAPEAELPIGEGGVRASVGPGEVRRVGAPFNLTPWARPPRVLLVLPANGTKAPGSLVSVSAALSTTIDAQTLADHVSLSGPTGTALPVTASVQTLVVAGGTFGKDGQERRSLLTLDFAPPFEDGVYRVSIGPGIRSTAGRAFDQDPSTAAEDGFESTFSVEVLVGGGKPCDACPDGYGCDDGGHGCVPLLTCAVGCPSQMVCDAAQNQCVQDCRSSGPCVGPAPRCDAGSGLCRSE